MARFRWLPAACGVVLGGFVCIAAEAQFGFYTLPKDDFTWTWGDLERRSAGRPDIEARGSEVGFRCQLTAALRPGSRLTTNDVREIENDVQASLQFIRDSTQLLNALDAQRELDWGVLECDMPEAAEVSEEERAEREAKARERMQREVDRRRARQQRDAE